MHCYAQLANNARDSFETGRLVHRIEFWFTVSLSLSLAHYLYVPLDPCVGERSFQGQANAFVRNCTCSVVVTATNARYPGEAGILAFPFSARMSKWDGKRLQVFFPFSPYHSLSLSRPVCRRVLLFLSNPLDWFAVFFPSLSLSLFFLPFSAGRKKDCNMCFK